MLLALLAAFVFLAPTRNAEAVASTGESRCPSGTQDGPSGECLPTEDPVVAYGTAGGLGDWPDYFINWGGTWSSTSDLGNGGGPSEAQVRDDAKEEVQKDPCNEEGGDAAASAVQPTTNYPVNVITGQKILPQADFEVPGDGIGLKVARNYIQDVARIGVFGKKWTSSIDYSLVFEYQDVGCWTRLDMIVPCNAAGKPLTAIYAYNPSGYPSSFTDADQDGVWTSGSGASLSLSSGIWTLDHASGSSTTFDSNGRPLTIKDERGLGLTYAYNGSHQLATITHTSGRSISVSWSNGKIVALTAPNGKVYGYGYNGSGHLASVVSPDNLGTRTYHYEAANVGALTGISWPATPAQAAPPPIR